MTDAYQWPGRTMVGSDGEKIDKISEIYEDPQEREVSEEVRKEQIDTEGLERGLNR